MVCATVQQCKSAGRNSCTSCCEPWHGHAQVALRLTDGVGNSLNLSHAWPDADVCLGCPIDDHVRRDGFNFLDSKLVIILQEKTKSMLKSILCITVIAWWHDLCFVSTSMLFCQAQQNVKQPRLSFPKTIATSGIPAADSKPTSTHRKRAHSCATSLSARCRQPPAMLFYIPSSPPEYYRETRADNAERCLYPRYRYNGPPRDVC
jgi:hypothetical protein